ncbi:MAG: anti-sigma F factor [Oscillospiraceae bacterium]
MKANNTIKVTFYSKSINESFARSVVCSFAAQLDPTLEELADIKTAVSEAVTNCIVHAYPDKVGVITLMASILENGKLVIKISDKGCGIGDIKKAMEPLYTTGNPEERAGLGFAVMESFMENLHVTSRLGKGTRVTMSKTLQTKS